MNGINFLVSLAWAEGSKDVGDLMLEIEKCCEGVLTPPTREQSENYFRLFDIKSIETQSVVPDRINARKFSNFKL